MRVLRPEIAGRRGRCAEQGSRGRRFCPVGPRRQRAGQRAAERNRGVGRWGPGSGCYAGWAERVESGPWGRGEKMMDRAGV